MCLAVPGQVESIRDEDGMRMGRVNFGGVVKDVCLAYLPEIAVGDYTIVHVGFAISRIDEQSARDTLRTFDELGLLKQAQLELDEPQLELEPHLELKPELQQPLEGGAVSGASAGSRDMLGGGGTAR